MVCEVYQRKSKRRTSQETKDEDEEKGVPTISADDTYTTEESHQDDEQHDRGASILAMLDHTSKMGFTSVVHSKEANPYAVLSTTNSVALLGYPKMIWNRDGEPAIMTFKEAVRADAAAIIEIVGKRKIAIIALIIPEQPAAYDSKNQMAR